jgi:hypothetical protein
VEWNGAAMASVDKELAEFVRDALGRGVSKDEIARVLGEAGWPGDRVAAAIHAYADIDFAIPVPVPRPYISARDAFVYFVLFCALGVSAFYLGSLLFSLIDIAFQDPILHPSRDRIETDIRWAVSFIVVAFPVFLFVAHKTSAEIRRDPEKRVSRIRNWLTYVALSIASLVILGDVVALIYNFLNGDLTVPIGLKILTIAAIAGTIFVYYLRLMVRDERAT